MGLVGVLRGITLQRRGKGVCCEDGSALMLCWLCLEPCMKLGIGTWCRAGGVQTCRCNSRQMQSGSCEVRLQQRLEGTWSATSEPSISKYAQINVQAQEYDEHGILLCPGFRNAWLNGLFHQQAILTLTAIPQLL